MSRRGTRSKAARLPTKSRVVCYLWLLIRNEQTNSLAGSESDVSMAGAEGPDSTQPLRGTEKQDARPKPPMDPVASTLINPLSTGQSEFMTAPTGRICKLFPKHIDVTGH